MKINFSREAKFYFEISLKKNFFFNEPSDILETKFWILNFEFSFQSSTQSSPLPPFFFLLNALLTSFEFLAIESAHNIFRNA